MIIAELMLDSEFGLKNLSKSDYMDEFLSLRENKYAQVQISQTADQIYDMPYNYNPI